MLFLLPPTVLARMSVGGRICLTPNELNARLVIHAVPPGGRLLLDVKNGVLVAATASIPLWAYWLQLANRHADAAVSAQLRARPPLEMARKVTESGQPEFSGEGNEEMTEAMLSISSTACALDAVFGSLQLVNPWQPAGGRKPGTRRPHEILEQLKHAFTVGKQSHEWVSELDWLFDLRDSIIHHAERPRKVAIAAADAEFLVLSAFEAYSLTGASAKRAANLADRILRTCLDHPRPATREWAASARKVKEGLKRVPGISGEPSLRDVQFKVGVPPGPEGDSR